MLVAQSVGYIGSQQPNGYVGFAHEGNFFAAFSIDQGVTLESGQNLFQNFKDELQNLEVSNLSSFESQITNTILKLNFPAHFNMAIGYVYSDVLYIKTVGKGQVYFRRGKDFDLLMEGDQSASGYVQEYDLAIFTTTKINELLGEVEDIKAFVDLDPPKEINEKILNEGYTEEATGFASIFVEFLSEETAELLPPLEEDTNSVSMLENKDEPLNYTPLDLDSDTEWVTQPTVAEPIVPFSSQETIPTVPPPSTKPLAKGFSLPFLSNFQFRQSRKISLVIVVILFGILLWSVVFGYQRRMAAEMQKKFETTQTQIQANLAKAEDEAYLNVDNSLALISESKELLKALKEEVGNTKEEQISKLQLQIDETESKIVKRDEKEAIEFYDLALEAEDAEGESVYLENNTVAVLDKKNTTVYILSLDSKSIDKYTSAEVGGATLVATYEDSVFILNPEKGIYEFTTSTKVKQVIEADGWGDIVDMEIYNGNIYVVDEGKNDVYKYLVAESGYSKKDSYFPEGQTVNIEESVGIAIDSAVYIAKKSEVLKFISGGADPFTTDYPEETPIISGIFTTADIEQVYIWDKAKATIYVVAKNGEYNRQVASSVLKNAKGVFVYEEKAYIFDGKKLYTLALD